MLPYLVGAISLLIGILIGRTTKRVGSVTSSEMDTLLLRQKDILRTMVIVHKSLNKHLTGTQEFSYPSEETLRRNLKALEAQAIQIREQIAVLKDLETDQIGVKDASRFLRNLEKPKGSKGSISLVSE